MTPDVIVVRFLDEEGWGTSCQQIGIFSNEG